MSEPVLKLEYLKIQNYGNKYLEVLLFITSCPNFSTNFFNLFLSACLFWWTHMVVLPIQQSFSKGPGKVLPLLEKGTPKNSCYFYIRIIIIIISDSTDQNIITIVYGTDFTNINFLSLLATKVCFFLVFIRNRSISTGLEPVLSLSEKLCLASY